jgi:hypothetical protein
MSVSAFPVQTPLNLIMPIKPGAAAAVRALLIGLASSDDQPVARAFTRLGNVHHAQFVVLETHTRLALLAWYDGSLADFVLALVEHGAGLLNALLPHIAGAEPLLPVERHRGALLAFVETHHAEPLHTFTAYPGKRMFDVKDALGL